MKTVQKATFHLCKRQRLELRQSLIFAVAAAACVLPLSLKNFPFTKVRAYKQFISLLHNVFRVFQYSFSILFSDIIFRCIFGNRDSENLV